MTAVQCGELETAAVGCKKLQKNCPVVSILFIKKHARHTFPSAPPDTKKSPLGA